MSKRISVHRTPENSIFFTEAGNHIRLDAGPFDAISMVADGEHSLGKIRKFYVTELHFAYESGATLTLKDIPPNLGAFHPRQGDHDWRTEVLQMDGVSPAVMVTAMGEAVNVLVKTAMAGYTEIATGTTVVHAIPQEIQAVHDGEVDFNHPNLQVYRSQTMRCHLVVKKSGFVIEATAEVAPA